MNKPHIYLDNGASTQVHPEVVAAMLPFWTETYGNPSSHHEFGRLANRALEQARQTIAKLLQAQPEEIVFTSCGSESDNLALRGVMGGARASGRGNHLITSCIEHGAVLQTAVQLRDYFGYEVTILPVNSHGQINLDELEAAIRPDTVLISIMAANNEIGTLQPIKAIGHIAHRHNVLLHTDAVQALATQRWNMAQMPIDLLSIAPHKFYGPKGVGILYVRQGIELLPAQTGGSHEDGRRAGTVNVPLAVGAAKAFELAMVELPAHLADYQMLRDRLIEGVLTAVPEGCLLTGHPSQRLPQHASFAFRHFSGNDLLMHLDIAGIAASSGSACKSGNPKPSAILEALGLAPEWTKGGLRLTIGRNNTLEEIEYTIQTIPRVLEKLQKLTLLFA